jgi:hypothetical protein
LKEHTAVDVEYETEMPRTAYIRGATRYFVGRNLQGLVTQGMATVVLVVVFVVGGILIRSAFRRLIQHRST